MFRTNRAKTRKCLFGQTFHFFENFVILKSQSWNFSSLTDAFDVSVTTDIIYLCHARMRELLSYLHIPKTTSMCHMYEATRMNQILMQRNFCSQTTSQGINRTMSYYFPLPPI